MSLHTCNFIQQKNGIQINISCTICLPAYLQRRLRAVAAVLNAAARMVFRLRRYDHVTDALAILHWLRVPEQVSFKLALMAYRVLNGMAPSYLHQLVPVSSLTGRRRLRSSFTLQLLLPSYRLSTVGRRSFPVAASMFWNTLPDDIQSAPSVSAFCRLLKHFFSNIHFLTLFCVPVVSAIA